MSYEDQTKEELQDELRERDLQISGTKDELIERLEEDDAASDDDSDGQDDEDLTKDELQDELRERDLKVSGTKDELIERLEEDDAASDDGSDGQDAEDAEAGRRQDEQRSQDGGAADRSSQRRGLKPRDAVRSAARELRELGGREVDGVAGFERIDGGWRILLEVVEVARVPSSTDVLGAYEVTIDDDGELVGYERIRRFVRSQAGGDDE